MNKLQKVVLALAATSSILGASAYAADNQFYITGGGGLLFGTKQLSDFTDSYTAAIVSPATVGVSNAQKYSFKSPKTGGEMFLGVGYYVTDKIRTELVFVKPWFGKQNIKGVKTVGTTSTNFDGKLTTQVNSAQLRGYFDAFDIADMGKAYVGAGIGWSQVKAKISTNNDSWKSKNKSNFAWMLGVGVSFDVVEEVKLGLEYNYQDFGRVTNPVNTAIPGTATSPVIGNNGKIKLRGHAVVAKLMFNI